MSQEIFLLSYMYLELFEALCLPGGYAPIRGVQQVGTPILSH